VHDGIEIERRGKASAVIITEPFIPTAKGMAGTQGFSSYPFAVIDHPVGSLTDEELRERARTALPQVRSLLLSASIEQER
jgi:hypothetical protein